MAIEEGAMNDGTATAKEVVGVLRYMSAAWPRAEATPETVAVYVAHLLRSRLAADVLLQAVLELVDTSKTWPSVAEILAVARQIAAQREAHPA